MYNNGLFSTVRSVQSSDAAFFALQVAISSYPGDPLRKELESIITAINPAIARTEQVAKAARALSCVERALSYIEYCVWDYSLIADVANKEFASWYDGVQEAIATTPEPEDVTGFLKDGTSYIVFTFAMLSEHRSLQKWLGYYPEQLSPHSFFERKTIESLLIRFATGDTQLLGECTNAMLALMPVAPQHFFSGEELRSEDWEYLRPVY